MGSCLQTDPRDPDGEGGSGSKRHLSHKPGKHQAVPRSKARENLELAKRKLTELAETFEPLELAGSAMDIYMRIRPKVPEGKPGWGKEGILDLDKVDDLIAKRRALKGG